MRHVIVNWGKHKGRRWSKVAASYLEWVVANSSIPGFVRQAELEMARRHEESVKSFLADATPRKKRSPRNRRRRQRKSAQVSHNRAVNCDTDEREALISQFNREQQKARK